MAGREIYNGLSRPGKIVFDRRTGLLAVADTASHRVVITDRYGAVKKIIGSGRPGSSDGPFNQAEFNSPGGMTFFRGRLYVADTGNHLIREIDFALEELATAAGTGDRRYLPRASGPPLEVPLNSPRDLAAAGERIYVAMAGSHQVWEFDPGRSRIGAFAGDGGENLRDGSLMEAFFARPSGLAADQAGSLYCCDSGTGSIRRIDLHAGLVETLVGPVFSRSGSSLGPFEKIRLRNPLGVAWDCSKRKLYVADSGNHRVVQLDPDRKKSRLIAGEFSEPGGLTVFDSGILVADTSASRIVKVTGEVVEEFRLTWPGNGCPVPGYGFSGRYVQDCGPEMLETGCWKSE